MANQLSSRTSSREREDVPLLVHRRRFRYSRLISGFVAVFAVAAISNVLLQSQNLRWDTVGAYLFDPAILSGLWVTIYLTLLAMIIAIVFGLVLALMRRSSDPIVRAMAWTYINFVRSIPLLVLILFAYFLAVLIPRLSVGIPFTDLTIWSADTNVLITPFIAAVVALGFGEAAYTSEILRGGLVSVSRGQGEAADSLGIGRVRAFAHIVAPQAMRVVIPGLGNETIGMLKATALVQIIGVAELLTTAQRIYAVNFQSIPLLVVVSIWYLVLTVLLSIGQHFLEKRMSRGFG